MWASVRTERLQFHAFWGNAGCMYRIRHGFWAAAWMAWDGNGRYSVPKRRSCPYSPSLQCALQRRKVETQTSCLHLVVYEGSWLSLHWSYGSGGPWTDILLLAAVCLMMSRAAGIEKSSKRLSGRGLRGCCSKGSVKGGEESITLHKEHLESIWVISDRSRSVTPRWMRLPDGSGEPVYSTLGYVFLWLPSTMGYTFVPLSVNQRHEQYSWVAAVWGWI